MSNKYLWHFCGRFSVVFYVIIVFSKGSVFFRIILGPGCAQPPRLYPYPTVPASIDVWRATGWDSNPFSPRVEALLEV